MGGIRRRTHLVLKTALPTRRIRSSISAATARGGTHGLGESVADARDGAGEALHDRISSVNHAVRPSLCMIVHGPYPIGEPRLARQARAARDAGFDVDVVAMRRDGEARLGLVDGIRVYRMPVEHRRGGGALQLLREYLGFAILATLRVARLAVRRRYAVVQVANPPDFLIAAGIVPKLFGARLVFDVHDLSPDLFETRFAGRSGARVADVTLRLVERLAVRLADEVLTVHDPYRQELVARGAPAAKVTVVMNSLDEELLPAPSTDRPGEEFRIVYHGTVTSWYGVELVVEALAAIGQSVPDAQLEVYGEGDAMPRVCALAEALGVSERLIAPGRYFPQTEVLSLVQGARVGVIPNLPTRLNRFALSSKLFEYVALGIPVISADLPTIRAHFDDKEIRYFRAGDAGSLADALVDVATDPDAAAARAFAARARYEEYRWSGNAARYVAVLNSAHDTPANRGGSATPRTGAAA